LRHDSTRCAVFKVEMAVASGWFQRAHRLLDDQDAVAERVWLTS
jgi:hypothetical protein